MSNRGFVLLDRNFLDHPRFKPKGKYTVAEAMIWLVTNATYQARRVPIMNGKRREVVQLEPGQIAASVRYLARAWNMDGKSVQRLLRCLASDQTLTTESATGQTIITLCNWGKYQRPFAERATDNATESATETPTKSKERKESKKNTCEFEEFWKSYPRRDGANPKAPAEKLFLAAVKAGADPAAIIAGVKHCAAAESKNIGTPYIPQAVKWLRDERWLDYAGANVLTPKFDVKNYLV